MAGAHRDAGAAGRAAAPRAELSLWRLDCGEFVFNDYNAFFSDTSEYAPGSKRLVGSCYLIRHGDRYMLWDTGIPGATVAQPIDDAGAERDASQPHRRPARPDQRAARAGRRSSASATIISTIPARRADFAHARLIMGAGDLAALRGNAPGAPPGDALRPWLQAGANVTEARGDVDVFERRQRRHAQPARPHAGPSRLAGPAGLGRR